MKQKARKPENQKKYRVAGKLFPSEVYVMVNGQQRKAMTDQLTTVSKQRVSNQEGRLSAYDMQQVEDAIKVQLELT